MLCCHGGLITVDNTLDSRLRLVEEQVRRRGIAGEIGRPYVGKSTGTSENTSNSVEQDRQWREIAIRCKKM